MVAASETRHGTQADYTYGCRCAPCVEGNASYRRALYNKEPRSAIRGRFSVLGDARPAREMIGEIADFAGLGGLMPVSRATGFPEATLRCVANGTVKRTRREVAEAVEKLHWTLWKNSGEFRLLCRCDLPKEIVEWWEKS